MAIAGKPQAGARSHRDRVEPVEAGPAALRLPAKASV